MKKKINTNYRKLNGGEKENPRKILAMELEPHFSLTPKLDELSIRAGEAGPRRRRR